MLIHRESFFFFVETPDKKGMYIQTEITHSHFLLALRVICKWFYFLSLRFKIRTYYNIRIAVV